MENIRLRHLLEILRNGKVCTHVGKLLIEIIADIRPAVNVLNKHFYIQYADKERFTVLCMELCAL